MDMDMEIRYLQIGSEQCIKIDHSIRDEIKLKKIALQVGVLCALAIVAFSSWADVNTSGFQVSAYAGVADTTANPGHLQLVNETDALIPKKHQLIDATGGVGAAYRFMLPASKHALLHDLSAGLDLLYFQTNQNGHTWQYQQSAYDNFTYQIPIDSLRLMADSELTFHPIGPYIFPFIEGGIGLARNTASYHDTPLIADYNGNVIIGRHVHYQFAYTAGGGIKVLLSRHTELSFRYLYADLGNAMTSATANAPLASPLTVRLTTQTWLVGLTYLL